MITRQQMAQARLYSKPCFVSSDVTDDIPFHGTFSECIEWLEANDPMDDMDYLICNRETGRAMSVVFSAHTAWMEIQTQVGDYL